MEEILLLVPTDTSVVRPVAAALQTLPSKVNWRSRGSASHRRLFMNQVILTRVELPHKSAGMCQCVETRLDIDLGIAVRELRSPACKFIASERVIKKGLLAQKSREALQ